MIAASGWHEWPPRLADQPIFYPVLNEWYATKIAREWNVPREGVGCVLELDMDAGYAARFPTRNVGGHDLQILAVENSVPVGSATYTRNMSMTAQEVEQALLALAQHERAAVIHSGLQSLDADDGTVDRGGIDAAWRTELRRRITDIESGKVELLDASESHAQMRAELAARRA